MTVFLEPIYSFDDSSSRVLHFKRGCEPTYSQPNGSVGLFPAQADGREHMGWLGRSNVAR